MTQRPITVKAEDLPPRTKPFNRVPEHRRDVIAAESLDLADACGEVTYLRKSVAMLTIATKFGAKCRNPCHCDRIC